MTAKSGRKTHGVKKKKKAQFINTPFLSVVIVLILVSWLHGFWGLFSPLALLISEFPARYI